MCEGIGVNSSLTALDLIDNDIKDKGAIALAAALITNASLTRLYLDGKRVTRFNYEFITTNKDLFLIIDDKISEEAKKEFEVPEFEHIIM